MPGIFNRLIRRQRRWRELHMVFFVPPHDGDGDAVMVHAERHELDLQFLFRID